MILKVKRTSAIRGRIDLPASKSYTIRAFIIAACGGVSHIKKPSNSEDAKASIQVAKALGAVVSGKQGSWKITAQPNKANPTRINVNESGTALRFLLPLLCLKQGEFIVDGKGTLRGRPNRFLLETLRSAGVEIDGEGDNDSIPIRRTGGEMRGGAIRLDGSLSSQFVSALLIACPQLQQDTKLVLTGKRLVSTDYITMTLQVLSKAGVKVKRVNEREFLIKGGQKIKGLKNFFVPSDYGLAAFPMAAAALAKSHLVLNGNLDDRYVQADSHILEFMRAMGVCFTKTRNKMTLKGPFTLRGGTFSLKDCPDLVPIMAVLAMFAEGKTRLRDIWHARAKESDRISDLRKELMKVGAVIEEKEHEMTIVPQVRYKEGCTLDPHRDHRLAMAFAVLGLKIGVTVVDMECCRKSYPDFIKDFKSLISK